MDEYPGTTSMKQSEMETINDDPPSNQSDRWHDSPKLEN